MFRLVTGVSGLLRSVAHQLPLRSTSVITVRTRNATTETRQLFQAEWDKARPYEDVPGPKPLPLIGNFWRFLPYIGQLPMFVYKAFQKFAPRTNQHGSPRLLSSFYGVEGNITY
jgi:hypothetical protein